MALVLEEVPELPSESPEEIQKPDKPDTKADKPAKESRARKVPEVVPEKTNWKEKVPCPGCSRLLSRHTLEFSHQCKGPKKQKTVRISPDARIEEPPPPHLQREQTQQFEPPAMSHDQAIRLMIKQERDRREAVMCAPMRRFYGLQ